MYKVMHEICSILGHYAARNDNSVPTFRDNLSVSSSRVKQFFFFSLFHRAFRFTKFYLYQRMHLFLSYTKIT